MEGERTDDVQSPCEFALVVAMGSGGETSPMVDGGLRGMLVAVPDIRYRESWTSGWMRWLDVVGDLDRTVAHDVPVAVFIHRSNVLFVLSLFVLALRVQCSGYSVSVIAGDKPSRRRRVLLGTLKRLLNGRLYVGPDGAEAFRDLVKNRREAA